MGGIFRHVITVAALSIALLALITGTVFAQASECSKKRHVGTHALDEFTWKQLNNVYEDVGENITMRPTTSFRKCWPGPAKAATCGLF